MTVTKPIHIPLRRKDGSVRCYALVDHVDAERVMTKRWSIDRDGYARAHCRRKGRQSTVVLHRFIMGEPKGMDVDHISGDRMDCRRRNLRVCTHAQNMMNHRGQHPPGRRGVRKMKNRWHARITVSGKNYHLGSFMTQEEAWQARRAAEIKLKGEFAPRDCA